MYWWQEKYQWCCLLSWRLFGKLSSKKQSSVSLSIAEAEYIAAAGCCTQILWMKQMLKNMHIQYDDPIPIFCDNTSAISISKNPVMHSKTKHIPIKYHFLREQVLSKVIKLEYVGTKDQLADIFTKPLPKSQFEMLRAQLGVCPLWIYSHSHYRLPSSLWLWFLVGIWLQLLLSCFLNIFSTDWFHFFSC